MSFSQRVISLIAAIPPGRIATYGQIAGMAGNPRGARGVVWILRSSSRKHDLPWHRVVAAGGRIALQEGAGREEQIARLSGEGIACKDGRVDLAGCRWQSGDIPDQAL